eukprot:m.18178 g.18178  ORF g.18178 m.18178 type:complete len:239 (+) comp27611_c0_seq4:51-767(+)
MNGLMKPSVEKTVEDFLSIADKEKERLENTCKCYEPYLKSDRLSEDGTVLSLSTPPYSSLRFFLTVQGLLRVTVGKARLLVKEKFEQFRKLCERTTSPLPPPTPIVCVGLPSSMKPKPEDLAAFWDLVRFQINDIDKNFDQLDEMKRNGWKIAPSSVGVATASPVTSKRFVGRSWASRGFPMSEKAKLRDEQRRKLIAAKKAEAKQKGVTIGRKTDFVEIYVGSPAKGKHVQTVEDIQ